MLPKRISIAVGCLFLAALTVGATAKTASAYDYGYSCPPSYGYYGGGLGGYYNNTSRYYPRYDYGYSRGHSYGYRDYGHHHSRHHGRSRNFGFGYRGR